MCCHFQILCSEITIFELPQEIISAIKNPQALEALEAESDEIQKIKALFVGVYSEANSVDTYSAAFQKFKSDQYISAAKIHLFLSGNTFVADNRIGLTIGRHIDCLLVRCFANKNTALSADLTHQNCDNPSA